jgi:hypothetical protein
MARYGRLESSVSAFPYRSASRKRYYLVLYPKELFLILDDQKLFPIQLLGYLESLELVLYDIII